MSVLVYTENWDGKFKKLSFELISYANEIAKKLNSTVVALSIGNVAEDELKLLFFQKEPRKDNELLLLQIPYL